MLNRITSIASVLIAAALGCSCARKADLKSSDHPGSPAVSTAPRQILRIGNGGEPQDLDPQAITGVPEHKLVCALFEGLASEDPQDLHPIPAGAESWDISPDGLTYTFHLRAARWSNGEAISAHDYVRSYQRMLSPAFASEYAYLIYNFVAGAKDYYDGKLTDFAQVGVKAPDDRTLRVTLANPTPYLLQIIASHYAWSVVPIDVITKFGRIDQKRTAWTRVGNLVGNGPFILKEWVPNQRITVVKNPQYWDAANVKLEEIQFFPTEDRGAEERMFRTGQLDQTYELPLTKIDTYRREYPAALHIEPYLGVYFYRCNVARPPLNDKRVRRALALAIDREAIVTHVMRGGQKPAYAVSYPGVAGYAPRAQLQGSLPEAKRLLADAGFPEGRGFPRIPVTFDTSANHHAVAEAIQQMWRKELGIDVELSNVEWKTYLDLQHTTNYTMQRGGWIADYVDPHSFLELWETGNGNNNTNWSSPEYDRLLRAALAARTNDERYEIYQKMDAILIDELPVIPIYFYTTFRALNPKVRGYYPTLLDNHPYKSLWIAE